MMLRKWALAASALLLLLPLAGCWSRKELNELAIVVGMGLDKKEQNYAVTVQIVNPGQVSSRNGMSSSMPPISTFTEWGKTIPEALRRMTTILSKRLYFSHLRIVVFGEDLAREGIGRPIDFISRDPQMRNDFYLVVAKDCKAADVLKVYSPIDPIPANNLNAKLANSDRLWAATGKITLDRLTIDLLAKGKDPTLTGIRITGDKEAAQSIAAISRIVPPATMEYYGMAAFRRDRMVGWLDENQAKALNYLQDQVNQTVATLDCPDGGVLSLNILDTKNHVHVSQSEGKPVIQAHLRVEANVGDLECKIDLSKEESLVWIREHLKKKLVDLITSGVKKAQKELHADIFGFGKEVHRQQPAIWHRVGDRWDDEFGRVAFSVTPEVYIRRIGTIEQSITQLSEE